METTKMTSEENESNNKLRPARRVAIVGAGASGLAALKTCLDEDGLEPVCYELTNDIGGLWNYRDSLVEDDVSCVMKTTVINTSKEMMAFSDFPLPAEVPNFLHNSLVLEYFRSYVENFGLGQFIKYGRKVKRIKKQQTRESDGQNGTNWSLEVEDLKSGNVTTELFDAVFIATGHHAKPNRPDFDGLETFTGEVLHTHDYRGTAARFENKTVLVVGIGNSGGDVAVEISRITKQTYLSTRRGTWLFNRVSHNGLPLDLVLTRRVTETAKRFLNVENVMERLLTQRFDHDMYGLRPEHGPMSAHPTINDELPNRIACGSVIIKSNITRIEGSTVHLSDGSRIDHVDTIVMATGYHVTFPFMQDQIFEVYDNHVGLYKYVFPPDGATNTLAVLGCIQPWGAIMPISEMQARIASKVFKKELTLPSSPDMWRDIKQKEEAMSRRYARSMRHTIQVDYVPYMDELADMLGCRPQLGKLLLTDPVLWYNVVFGPATPYQYRLHGPGAWKGARAAILSQWSRIHEPFRTRRDVTPRVPKPSRSFLVKVCLVPLFGVIMYYLFKFFR